MEMFWGVFQKRLADMTLDERMILLLVVLISLCLVLIAVSLLLQVARKLDWSDSQSVRNQKSLRKGLGRLSQVDYFGEDVRTSHTD